MQLHQPELLNPREKHWSKSQLPFSEATVPVIPRGLVAARVLAFQAASSKTWSTNSRVIPRQKLAASQDFDAPPLIKRKPNYKKPRNLCEPLSSVTQTLSNNHQCSCILSIGKPVPCSEGGGGRSANNSNLEVEDFETEESIGLFRGDMADNVADEAGDILDGAMKYQPQGEPEVEKAPSFCLNKLDRDVRLAEAKRSYLNMPPTKSPSLGGRVGNRTIPLGSSRPHPSSMLEGSTQSKKYRFWRGGKGKSILNDSLEITRAIGPHINPQPLLYSNVSAAQSQQALTLGPLGPTKLEIKDSIELHSLPPGQVPSSSTGESANTGESESTGDSVSTGHRDVAGTISFKEAKALESITPTRSVRHSISMTSMRPPSQTSSTQSTLSRWSWWNLGGRKQRAAGRTSANGREDHINPASEKGSLIQLELFPNQPSGYEEGTVGQACEDEPACANDPTKRFQISSKEPESVMGRIVSAAKGIISPRKNETQIRSCVELPLSSTPPQLDLRPSPDLCVSPTFAADPLSQEGSSGAASTIRLRPDKSGGAVRWRNRGQSFQRVQIIVNVNMKDLVVKEKIEKKGKDKAG